MVFWGLKSSKVSNAYCKGTDADTQGRECLGKGIVKLELMMAKYQQAIPLGVGVERGSTNVVKKSAKDLKSRKQSFHITQLLLFAGSHEY